MSWLQVLPDFDADYYQRARLDKPKKNKNYKEFLKLEVDSEIHFTVHVPVKMNFGAAPMAVIVLDGEIARAFINASVEEREAIIEAYNPDWKTAVDERLMSAKRETDDFLLELRLGAHRAKTKLPPHETVDGVTVIDWGNKKRLTVDEMGVLVFQKKNKYGRVKKVRFDVTWDDHNEIVFKVLNLGVKDD